MKAKFHHQSSDVTGGQEELHEPLHASSTMQALSSLASHSALAEETMCNSTMSSLEKMKVFVDDVKTFFNNEATCILGGDLVVTNHAAFGHIKTSILSCCTCKASERPTKMLRGKQPHVQCESSGCSVHMNDPDVNELTYEIAKAVHLVFGDSWSCFASLFATLTSEGKSDEGHGF